MDGQSCPFEKDGHGGAPGHALLDGREAVLDDDLVIRRQGRFEVNRDPSEMPRFDLRFADHIVLGKRISTAAQEEADKLMPLMSASLVKRRSPMVVPPIDIGAMSDKRLGDLQRLQRA
jgi:hypothetical protein